ncbi:MAG TPA: NPCBM/NEW2 domain-containing protein [Streptosporangiaceae bacterium]
MKRSAIAAAAALTLVAALLTAVVMRPAPARALDNGLARTPPMGWNDWNAFGCNVNDSLVRATADAFVSLGLRDAGYTYVNIDDCWMTRSRDAQGNLVPDPVKFPNGIKAVADYVHARGLKLGIYESAGTATCAGFAGSLDHEQADARLFASWGVDYLKYDNCNNQGRPSQQRYTAMRDAIAAAGRPMVYSITEWGTTQPWLWAQPVGNLWRTTGDIGDSFGSMLNIFKANVALAPYAAPGAWNDPDMLEIGNGGMTDTEYRSHFSLWAMMAAPLLAGTDLRNPSAATLAILRNRDVVAVDQDPLGVQAREMSSASGRHVLSRPLSGGDYAVALFNETSSATTISTTAAAAGLPAASSYGLRDLWSGATQTSTGTISAPVPAHGTVVFRVTPSGSAGPTTTYISDMSWLASTNGWGPAERDRSNGEQAAGDGHTLTIAGVTYAKGVGAHAAGTIDVNLGGRCSAFAADVGVDAEVGAGRGSVTFSVLGDGVTLASTPVKAGGQAATPLSVDVSGRTTLRLAVGNGGDTIDFDHADWANARVTCQ